MHDCAMRVQPFFMMALACEAGSNETVLTRPSLSGMLPLFFGAGARTSPLCLFPPSHLPTHTANPPPSSARSAAATACVDPGVRPYTFPLQRNVFLFLFTLIYCTQVYLFNSSYSS